MKKNNFLKLKPMLLQEIDEPFNDKNYLFEIKYDGIRALIYINNDEIIIKSRNNIILNKVFPELLEIKNITNEECIFDGEIVLFDNNLPNFSKLQERSKLKSSTKINYMINNNPVTFICFDILYKNKDLTKIPLIERKKILKAFNDTTYFKKIKYIENNGKCLFNLVYNENLEGIIAKIKTSLYTYNIRSNDWLKIKNYKTETFNIYGYIDEINNYTITLVLGEIINNKHYFVGKVLLGKKDLLYEKLKKEKRINNILENYTDTNTIFINPNFNIDISYLERTKNNNLRTPFIKKINK